MIHTRQRRVLFCLASFVATIVGVVAIKPQAQAQESAPPPAEQQPSLIKDAYKDYFSIGMAGDLPGRYSDEELKLVKEHFNFVTPENCMKPEPVHPSEATWRFERTDPLVAFCVENDTL